MRTLFTRWIPETETKPVRIRAHDEEGNSYTISRDQAHDLIRPVQGIIKGGYTHTDELMHRLAVTELCIRMGWDNTRLIAGRMKNGYAFVFKPQENSK